MAPFRIGTRRSPLALAQTRSVVEQWHAAGHRVEVVPIVTRGDRMVDRALDQLGGKGLFTTELEQALMDGRIDAAVHSLKDLPTRLPDGLTVGAVTVREDARDGLLAPRPLCFDALPSGARLGTSSLRRAAMLRAVRPDLEVVPVRGNLNTRWAKLTELHLDGLVLAVAGARRLGWNDRVVDVLDPGWMVPAPGQGALAVEVRTDDARAEALCRVVHDPATADATAAERAILDWLGGNCQIPVGAYATPHDHRWSFTVWVGRRDAGDVIQRSWEGWDLVMGRDWMLQELEAAGARQLVQP
jgi:hydroxymethylbilane synthase